MVVERESCLYFFHFGLPESERILSWVNPADYFSLTNSMILSQTDPSLLLLSRTCELGGYLESGECRANLDYMCFRGAISPLSFPLDTSSL